MARAECSLLYFTEEVVGVAIEFELTKIPDWHQLFRPDLGGIENIEIEVVLVSFWDGLYAKFPLGRCSILNGFPQIFPVEIWVLASKFQSLVPDKGMYSKLGGENELNERTFILAIDQAVGVDTETLHHSKGPWNSAVGHGPRVHVSGFRVHVDEIPEIVVC